MTPESQRIALAKACGWKLHEATRDNPIEKGGMRLPQYFENRDSVDAWTHADYPGVYSEPPKYLSDLNAVHEAKLTLLKTWHQRWRFVDYLDTIIPESTLWSCEEDLADRYYSAFPAICATAAQQSEALLRALDLWEET